MAYLNGELKEIKSVPISELIPYVNNARKHSEIQIQQIAASIKEFGFNNPILIDSENGIIAGHGRMEGARLLGLDSVPCIEVKHLTEAQKKAFIIADNQIATRSEWDFEKLQIEVEGLNAEDFNLDLLGFDPSQIIGMLDSNEGLTDPDEIPENVEPVAKLGDVWRLGRHTLVCGDCTDEGVVSACLNGVTPHLMVTDPPYGVEYDANWRNEALRGNGEPIGDRAVGKVNNDERADWREAWALFPGDVAYVWHAGNKANVVADSLIACDLEIRSQIIWAKNNIVIGRGDYHPKHEACWYAVKKKATGHWQGSRKENTIWNIDKPRKSETGHSTQKPVECMKRPIENNSSAGQAVYEPFSGSGTTIIAAEMTGRCCHAIELNPEYVDIAVKRWEDFTGEKAELQVTLSEL
jgi:DNA modification methylase